MRFENFSAGSVRIDGVTNEHDVVITRGEVRKQKNFPDISVGSYPNFEAKELVISCLGADPKRVDEVVKVDRRRSEQVGMIGDRR